MVFQLCQLTNKWALYKSTLIQCNTLLLLSVKAIAEEMCHGAKYTHSHNLINCHLHTPDKEGLREARVSSTVLAHLHHRHQVAQQLVATCLVYLGQHNLQPMIQLLMLPWCYTSERGGCPEIGHKAKNNKNNNNKKTITDLWILSVQLWIQAAEAII